MKANIASRLHTDTPLLKDLIADIRKGTIKIPQFQRKFVWREAQALNLLDSIGNNYPVGSLLLWRTDMKLAAERNIGNFTLPDTDDMSPTDYVLDGQQRLTVIYSCFGAPEDAQGFASSYDLLAEEFIQNGTDHLQHAFPLRWFYETTKLLNFRTALVGHPKGPELQSRLDSLLDVIGNYRIPVVVLKELTVEEVCPIFERINSSGTRLSTYDLMVAATWTKSFNLDDEAVRISDALSSKGFGDISGDTILKCLAAIKHSSIKRERVLSLRNLSHPDMDELVSTTEDALLKAVDLLVTEFKLYSWDFLPYEAIIVVLAYIFSRRPRLSREEIARVRQWFWRASFSERYRGAADTFISRDLETIEAFVTRGEGKAYAFGEPPISNELLSIAFRHENSRTRAFILALAAKNPRNLTNGIAIDTTEALSSYNKKQFHHIYPLAYLRQKRIDEEHNSLVNICILSASENKKISDANPNTYIPELADSHGSEAELVFDSNLMPSPKNFDYHAASFSDFCVERALQIGILLRSLCERQIAAS